MILHRPILLQDKLKCGIEDENTDRIIAQDFALSCPEGCITYIEQNLFNPIFEFNSDDSLSLNNTHPNVKVIYFPNDFQEYHLDGPIKNVSDINV